MDRMVESITLYRTEGVLMAVEVEADALSRVLQKMGVRLLLKRHAETRKQVMVAGFPDQEPWRAVALQRLAQWDVPVHIVDGPPVIA